MIYEKSKRKEEEVEAMKKSLQKTLHEDYNYPIINCRYDENLDQFIAYCFVDRNDDDSLLIMKFDYDEVIARTCDVNVELLLRDRGV